MLLKYNFVSITLPSFLLILPLTVISKCTKGLWKCIWLTDSMHQLRENWSLSFFFIVHFLKNWTKFYSHRDVIYLGNVSQRQFFPLKNKCPCTFKAVSKWVECVASGISWHQPFPLSLKPLEGQVLGCLVPLRHRRSSPYFLAKILKINWIESHTNLCS